MLSAIIIAAIAVAIFLGYKTKLNTGLFCIVFAYIIGCLIMGLKPKQVISFWPVSTMFVILSVSLFYNVAAKDVRIPALFLPKISRYASLCSICRSRHPFHYGSNVFHCPSLPGSHYDGHLR